MRRITALSLLVLLCACSKTEQAPSASGITGKWHMAKFVDWVTVGGVTTKDSTILDPLAILAEFKADTILIQERNGTVYRKDTQTYSISGNTLFWTKYWNPTVVDTFQILTLNSNTLSLYKKSTKSNSVTQSWNYWVR